MADPTPTQLGGCDENLPLLPITRQFDFGQFVFLRQSETPGSHVGPTKPSSKAIVYDPSGGMYQSLHDWLERVQEVEVHSPFGRKVPPKFNGPVADLGGVSLSKVLKGSGGTVSTPLAIEVGSAGLAKVLKTGKVAEGGQEYELDVDAETRKWLSGGSSVLAMARLADSDSGEWFTTELKPNVAAWNLTTQEVDAVLASGQVSHNGQTEPVELDEATTSALLGGEPALARVNSQDGLGQFVRLVPPPSDRKPAALSVAVDDLARFLTEPAVPGADGQPIPVQLSGNDVHELRQNGAVTVMAGTTPVAVSWRDGTGCEPAATASSAAPMIGVHPLTENTGSGGAGTAEASGSGKIGAPKQTKTTASPIGVPIAVFLPWRQSWKLTGFSRGELRHSLALAPQEERTIEVSSWERRLRTLDQAATTDVDQSFEWLQTERETDDVFQELTNRHDFAWQIEGSVDATYTAGTGSITVGAGGVVSDAHQLQQIARNTHQRMKESTQKASAKIRSIRTTRITDTVESGGQERVTRLIRNPNFSHTLTLDFFETLSNYEVTLAPVPARLGLVALVPNPLATKEFDTALMRRNETALRRALLDPALVDGFEACRKITSYKEAMKLLEAQAAAAKREKETKEKETSGDSKKQQSKQTPQELEVVELLTQIHTAAYEAMTNANVQPALEAIKKRKDVTEVDRRDAQLWLFERLCAKYLPSLLDRLNSLPATPTIADAGGLVALIPAAGSPVTVASLNDKSDWEKEQAGLGPQIAKYVGGDFNWAWSTGRCREEALYTANDAGLGGLLDRLARAYEAWQTKRSEGEMAQAKEVAIANASAQQDKLTSEDKLAMAFPLDELSSAYEREEALRTHINAHRDHYSFAMFQSLSPAEQNEYIERASSGSLEVGMFEPRVIAISGDRLAVPLSPPPAGPLHDMLEALRTSFDQAFAHTADLPDTFIFPTPGLTINSRLGKCTACEEFIEESRKIELRRLGAAADAAEQEAARREARIKAGDLDDPEIENAPVRVQIDKPA
jgi:hypothetical protein